MIQSPQAAWDRLRRVVSGQAPRLSAPPPEGRGMCACCRGPVRPGRRRCYQCEFQAEGLAGLLPDVVVPVAYAPKGGIHARNLWFYKSGRAEAGAARALLGALLVVFLRDHGPCVWRRAGTAGPTHLAVVPSGRGRPGAHPLQALAAECLRMPVAVLSVRDRDDLGCRAVSPNRFRTQDRIPGADVLLVDDTWTSGASCRSAAATLKLAGARTVAVVVLGRHISLPPAAVPQVFARQAANRAAASQALARQAIADRAMRFRLEDMPFRPALCAVHRAHAAER